MEVVVLADPGAVGEIVADAVESLVGSRPGAVLGLATGSSPLPVYAELVRRHRQEGLSFEGVHAFLLDEYVGLVPEHPQRYRNVIETVFAGQVTGLTVHAPGGVEAGGAEQGIDAACAAYESSIAAAGGIDLQLLGVGGDGHIGFNEPGSSLASRTRLKTLTRHTREDNARFFGGDPEAVPHHVLTQGVATILAARHLVLVAIGVTKAAAVAALVEGPITASFPASVLQLHPHVSVVIDLAAASGLERLEQYRDAWDGKPSWQRL